MPKSKWNLNTIYISERLQESLRPISRCAMTTVVAPMGYGKTTAVEWYLAERAGAEAPYIVRISVYSSNLAIFWKSGLIQSFYALGSGGLFGVGLFNSRQKYLFLPFSESDFIFSVIGEELGYFGCAAVIAVYVVIIWRAVRIAKNSNDRFGCYLSAGIAALIAVQTLINIAVVSGSIPPTGLPLPFVSAGSSSLIVFCASVGVLLSVERFSHKSVKCLIGK